MLLFQMVWANTDALGCGVAVCNTTCGTGWSWALGAPAQLAVCHYAPRYDSPPMTTNHIPVCMTEITIIVVEISRTSNHMRLELLVPAALLHSLTVIRMINVVSSTIDMETIVRALPYFRKLWRTRKYIFRF